jgi:hypothetical protein
MLHSLVESAQETIINFKIEKMKYFIIIPILTLMIISSCSKKNNIIITTEYIQNDYWKEKRILREFNGIPVNAVQVLRLKLKDSISFKQKHSLEEYVNEDMLEIDTVNKEQNCWAFIPKTEKIKIYFDKDYDNWSWNCYNFRTIDDKYKKKNIGKLKNNTWYLFNYLRSGGIYDNKYLVYIYVDEKGETHMFIRNLINV